MSGSPRAKPRPSRLQFSLRLLLLAFTGFAIGFPIWYRWPYEETEYRYPGGDSTKPPIGSTLKTWRRTWGGGKVQSGRAVSETQYRGRTVRRSVEHFHEGQRHGPIEAYYEGHPVLLGRYKHGQREGVWTSYDYSTGDLIVTAHWHQDRLDGAYERTDQDGRKRRYAYCQGRLISADGNRALNPLLVKWNSGAIDDPRIAEELHALIPPMTGFYGDFFVETPLKDALAYLQDQRGIPIVLDARRVTEIDRPTTLNIEGNDLWSALTLVARYHDLGLDFRYGVLFLTTAEHASDERDPTGVSDIRPHPGSPLARAWNEPCRIEAIKLPLDQVLHSLGQPLSDRV